MSSVTPDLFFFSLLSFFLVIPLLHYFRPSLTPAFSSSTLARHGHRAANCCGQKLDLTGVTSRLWLKNNRLEGSEASVAVHLPAGWRPFVEGEVDDRLRTF